LSIKEILPEFKRKPNKKFKIVVAFSTATIYSGEHIFAENVFA
jgi:hypothetical protein